MTFSRLRESREEAQGATKPHAKASPPGLWLEREASMGESSSPPLRRLRVAGERGALGLPSPEGGTRVWEGLVGNSGGKCGFDGSASGEVYYGVNVIRERTCSLDFCSSRFNSILDI